MEIVIEIHDNFQMRKDLVSELILYLNLFKVKHISYFRLLEKLVLNQTDQLT